MNEAILEAIENLQALKEESDVSKKFKEKADKVIAILQSNKELNVEKAIMELEEISNSDASTYLRTQIWAVISILESISKD